MHGVQGEREYALFVGVDIAAKTFTARWLEAVCAPRAR